MRSGVSIRKDMVRDMIKLKKADKSASANNDVNKYTEVFKMIENKLEG